MHDKHTLIVGGCKSGKSRYAQRLCERLSPERLYVATCVPLDEEMNERVRKHRADRDHTWQTVEEPLDLSPIIRNPDGGVVLVDCLTLWLTNMLMKDMADAEIDRRIADLIDALSAAPSPVVLVANEVGMGIVPDNALARRFRDLAGIVNQRVAGALGRVVLTVAGIPMAVKGEVLL